MSEYVALGDWRLGFDRRDRVKAAPRWPTSTASPAQYFVTSNRTLGTFIPSAAPVRAPAPARVDVASVMKDFKGGAAVAAGENFDVSPDNIARRTTIATLPGVAGVRTALLPKSTRGGKVVATIALRLGDEKSLFGKDIVGAAAASMLSRGTERLTREQLAAAFEKLQTLVERRRRRDRRRAAAGDHARQSAAVARSSPSEVLRTPRFDAGGVRADEDGLGQRHRVGALRSAGARCSQRLERHGNPYPKGDVRYAMTFDETLSEIAALKLDDVRAFHREFYGASNASWWSVGDFDAAAVTPQLQKELGDWASRPPTCACRSRLLSVPPADFRIEVKDKQNAVVAGLLEVPLREDRARIPGAAPGGADLRRLGRRQRPALGPGAREGRPVVRRRRLPRGRPVQRQRRLEPVRHRRAAEHGPACGTAFDQELARARRDGFTADELSAPRKRSSRRSPRARPGRFARRCARVASSSAARRRSISPSSMRCARRSPSTRSTRRSASTSCRRRWCSASPAISRVAAAPAAAAKADGTGAPVPR